MLFLLNPRDGNGIVAWWEMIYSSEAVIGVSVLVVVAAISLLAAAAMLIAIVISSFRTNHAFIRSHLGAYFVSLIAAEMIQATGSIMSARWIASRGVFAGTFCAAQGALKNAGNVSTSLWTMVIAFHTFTLVFFKARVPSWILYSTLISVWLIVGFIIILGPASLQLPKKGPFWGVSGYWCWITDDYVVEQFTMEYLFMALTAVVSVILYFLIFLRLRGNIEGVGFRVFFCRTRTPWQSIVPNMSDPQIQRVGTKMLLYPICYVVLVLPITASRWSRTYGHKVPFWVTIFADGLFVSSGFVNAVLYSTTRRVVPRDSIIPVFTMGNPGMSTTEKSTDSFEIDYAYPRHSPPNTPPEIHIHGIQGYATERCSFDSVTYDNTESGYGAYLAPDRRATSYISHTGKLVAETGDSVGRSGSTITNGQPGRLKSGVSDTGSGMTWFYERNWGNRV